MYLFDITNKSLLDTLEGRTVCPPDQLVSLPLTVLMYQSDILARNEQKFKLLFGWYKKPSSASKATVTSGKVELRNNIQLTLSETPIAFFCKISELIVWDSE
jgi:hypothetical protein